MGMMIFQPYRTVLFLALSVAFLQFVKCQDEVGKLLFIHEANCSYAKADAFDFDGKTCPIIIIVVVFNKEVYLDLLKMV